MLQLVGRHLRLVQVAAARQRKLAQPVQRHLKQARVQVQEHMPGCISGAAARPAAAACGKGKEASVLGGLKHNV